MEDAIDFGDVKFLLVYKSSRIVNREQIWGTLVIDMAHAFAG